MPHVIVEYAQEVEQEHDIQHLCKTLFTTTANCACFKDSVSAIKVRATPYKYSVIGIKKQSFVHVTMRLLDGRDDDTKISITEAILNTLIQELPTVGSLSVDIKDISSKTYRKTVQ